MYSQLSFRANWLRQNNQQVSQVTPAVFSALQHCQITSKIAPAQAELVAQLLCYFLARFKPFLGNASCQNFMVDALQTALALPEKTALPLTAAAVTTLIQSASPTPESIPHDPFMTFILASSLLAKDHQEFQIEFCAGKGFQQLLHDALGVCEAKQSQDHFAFVAETTALTAAILNDFANGRETTPWYVEQQLFTTLLQVSGYSQLIETMGKQAAFGLLVAIGMENKMSLKQLVSLWSRKVKLNHAQTEQLLPKFVEALERLDLAFVEGLHGMPTMAVALTLDGVKLTQSAFKAQTNRLPPAVRAHKIKKATRLYQQQVEAAS